MISYTMRLFIKNTLIKIGISYHSHQNPGEQFLTALPFQRAGLACFAITSTDSHVGLEYHHL